MIVLLKTKHVKQIDFIVVLNLNIVNINKLNSEIDIRFSFAIAKNIEIEE